MKKGGRQYPEDFRVLAKACYSSVFAALNLSFFSKSNHRYRKIYIFNFFSIIMKYKNCVLSL